MSAGNGLDTSQGDEDEDLTTLRELVDSAHEKIDTVLLDMRSMLDVLRGIAKEATKRDERLQLLDMALAQHAGRESERGHEHASALVVLTADLATIRARVDAQEDLHAQRHRLVLDELRALRSDLALTRSKAHEAIGEARASRPDDGRLTEIAARVLEAAADDRDIENERKRESIRARAEKRSAVLRWVGQVVGWLTVGGGIVLALQHC